MKKLLLVSLVALIGASPLQAKALKWGGPPPGIPAGAKMAVVSGDPTKEGEFTIRARLPANYVVPPHNHPTDEKVSVKSGGPLTYGMGDKMDKSNAGSLEKGYHVTMGAKMNHWVSTTDATEIEISGMGPFAITYVNPADDPRNAK
jgi:hypothetical protein